VLSGAEPATPVGWRLVEQIPGLQFEGSGVDARPDDEAVELGADDVPEMLDLVARTRPGPFREQTHRMGGYLGIRLGGALIAMAGRRMHPPGWTEISAVCTDPDHRGKGLAARLVRAVAAGIEAGGDVPFLHVAAVNTGAIRLYEAMGFTLRREVLFSVVRAPG
jgi:ribosomal protein S18 acetylase RimI-like enzyme